VVWGFRRLRSGGLQFKPAQTNSSRDPHLQNNQSKMDWRCGSSRRAPALQVWNAEFKPQSHKKKKEEVALGRKFEQYRQK
jgi:hypothetical protein